MSDQAPLVLEETSTRTLTVPYDQGGIAQETVAHGHIMPLSACLIAGQGLFVELYGSLIVGAKIGDLGQIHERIADPVLSIALLPDGGRFPAVPLGPVVRSQAHVHLSQHSQQARGLLEIALLATKGEALLKNLPCLGIALRAIDVGNRWGNVCKLTLSIQPAQDRNRFFHKLFSQLDPSTWILSNFLKERPFLFGTSRLRSLMILYAVLWLKGTPCFSIFR